MKLFFYQWLLLPVLLFSTTDLTETTTLEKSTTYGVTIQAGSKSAKVGGQVCVDVSTRDFNNIVSMQYTMQWDKKVLKYKGVQAFGLPGMSKGNFGERLIEKGKLTFSWYDFNVRGVTVPSGSVLYQVCYDVIGDTGSKAYISFSGAPTVVEITDVHSNFLEMNSVSGKVTVK